jgi:pyruvate ferredoxin oxidoreductase beta subunit
MSSYKEIAQRDSCFHPGSSLCPGCMEAVALNNMGRVTDNGIKTIVTLGTSCAEVSTLAFPNIVAWGRGKESPDDFTKSFGVMHNVFESSPTVAEAVRDVADVLHAHGAMEQPVQVVGASGDGGALAIGLRSLLHTINRGANITFLVLVNEVFANTGFQYSPAAIPFSESSTTPVGPASQGNPAPPLDYLHLVIAAGADLVAQVSPAHGKLYLQTLEKALACKRTAVIFVPAPCISGWKFDDGQAVELALLGAQCGVFPTFIWERGKGGSVKDCSLDAAKRPALEEFLGMQRRFQHLVVKDAASGKYVCRPGREETLDLLKAWTQGNVERLYKLAELK